MPAYLLEQTAPQEDTQEKRERLKREIEGYTGAGAVYRRRIRRFMEEHGIWRIEELDYSWRLLFAEELHGTVKTRYHSFYLKCFDHIRQYDMRRQVWLQVSWKNQRYPYEDSLLFLPYHPVQELVQRLDACPERPEWVWDFSRKAPGEMKRQIFDILNHFLEEDRDGKLLRDHLKRLWRFYQFCLNAQVEDIEQMGLEQTMDYQKQVMEEGQPKAAGIIDTCRRILFLQAKEINWDADVWYLERFCLKKTLPQHHDRSVEEKTADEILQKLHRFPEKLRLMYLHLWGIGLRVSEVCTLKGNAYYIQGRDTWIQVYQIKMKTYKRIPIPAAVYQLMQVYLKKHRIAADSYIFQNTHGGAYHSGTFRSQMVKCCRELGIQGGEYMFQSHDYRHGVATYFYDSGVSIQGVRDYLGHAYEEMTRQYIDYMPDKLDRSNKEFFTKPGNSLMARLKEGDA